MLSSRPSRANGWRAFSIPLAVAALLALAAPVSADPPGNNGTIKVDGVDFTDIHPNNEPHVDCNFQIDFYGFDATPGLNAEVIYELQPPTAAGRTMTVTGPSTVFVGHDDNSGGGSEAGHDASQAYTLAFTGDPHPEQGFHVKLTIHAPGSQGADVKHKVFWVAPCPPTVTNNPPPPPPGNGGSGTLAGNPPPREGTQASVTRVPNTAVAAETGAGALILTAALLGILGSGAIAAIRLRAR
jgi:hypothetical protein